MSFALKDIDRGWNTLKKRAEQLARKGEVTVGVHDSDADRPDGKGDADNVLIGTVHEFGSPSRGITEHSFIRSTMDRNTDKYRALCRELSLEVLDGKMSTQTALRRLGLRVKADMIAAIDKSEFQPGWQPLKQATIDRKGSSKPLIDTAALKQSIDEVVNA